MNNRSGRYLDYCRACLAFSPVVLTSIVRRAALAPTLRQFRYHFAVRIAAGGVLVMIILTYFSRSNLQRGRARHIRLMRFIV